MRVVGGSAMQGVTKGEKTEGSSSRVCAIAEMIFCNREPVRFQAVWSSGRSVGGQWEDVLTVMMDFSVGMCE